MVNPARRVKVPIIIKPIVPVKKASTVVNSQNRPNFDFHVSLKKGGKLKL